MTSNGDGEKNGRGRPRKYMTVERFEKFVNNEFYHLKLQVKYMIMLGFTILGAVIANFFIG